MSKTLTSKNISAFLNQSLTQGQDLLSQVIPDKKLLKKYETLLEKKFAELKNSKKIEELVKPLRRKLEKSCVKPLEAKNLHEFSQRVVAVLRVQAKKQKKNFEKKMGIKKPMKAKKAKKRAASTKRVTA